MKKKSNIGWWIAGLAGALWMINRNKSVSGIGKVERIKRRIYKEVSLAQDAGVDFSKKFPELSRAEMDALEHIGKDVIGWKQSKRSIESGKPYVESYYGSLRRAWNAVSGVQGIGRAYDVRNADGDVVLTWNDVKEHIQQEPDAHTMLALPPHIEPKKPKAKKQSKKDEEILDRDNFATMFILSYMDGDGYAGVEPRAFISDFWKRDYTLNGETVKIWELLKWAWVNKKFKLSKLKMTNMLDGKEYDLTSYGPDKETFEMLDKYYKIHLDDKGWRKNEDQLDEIRLAILDKAKHMHVSLPKDVRDAEYDKLSDESKMYVKGDERYNYLPYINWIFWVHQTYERGGDTYYPMFSFDTKEDAMTYKYGYYTKNKPDHGVGWKILPIWDVPIEKITGVSGICGERFDARYVSDRSGNWYVMLDESFLPEMIRRGASEYDITVAQNQLDSCGRIIVFIEDWLQTLDNEYYLEEVYYIIDKMREHGDL